MQSMAHTSKSLSKKKARALRRFIDDGIPVKDVSRYSLESLCWKFGIHRYGSNTMLRSSDNQLRARIESFVEYYTEAL